MNNTVRRQNYQDAPDEERNRGLEARRLRYDTKTDDDSLFHYSRDGLYSVENVVIIIFHQHQQVADWVVALMEKHSIIRITPNSRHCSVSRS